MSCLTVVLVETSGSIYNRRRGLSLHVPTATQNTVDHRNALTGAHALDAFTANKNKSM